MKLKLLLSIVAFILFTQTAITAQELNMGVKIGGGISNTSFTPATFHFSTVSNETAYISAITDEKLYTGLMLNIDYQSKNKSGVYFDLFTQTMNYEFKAFSDDPTAGDIGQPLLSTTYLTTALGYSYTIIQRKLIKPYFKVGVNMNVLLRSKELDNDLNLFYFQNFTNWHPREVRNAIMFDHLNQQSPIYYSGHIGFGLKVYNIFVEGIWTRNISDLDKIGAYASQSKILITVGVNLLKFDLVKTQKHAE